jgi:hypothetical protein
MRDRRRTTIAALAGGAALASAGFAIGSQDDGSATAATDRSGAAVRPADRLAGPGPGPGFIHRAGRPGGPHRMGLGSLADRLGVSQAKLHDALDDLRPKGDPGDEMTAALAKELGISAERLREAFDAVHERRHDEFARQLAEKLGVSVDKVKDALPAPPGP